MIVKWNNNIVDYKFKVFLFIFFTLQIHPFFFFFLCWFMSKKKREHATYDIRESYCKPVAPALCWCNPPRVCIITPNGSRTRVSGAGGGRSNKERQRLQPLVSVARAPVFEVRRVRFTHRLYWHTHLLHWHPTVGINAPPEWRTTWVSAYRI